MDTSALEAAYRDLLAVARGGLFTAPEQGPDAPALLASLVATDRLLAGVTAGLLAGATPSYDSTPATSPAYLAALAKSVGDHDGLVAEVRRCGLVLVLLARDLGEAAARPVDVRLVDDTGVRLAAPMPWSGVLSTHAEVDLPARTAALAALA